jgi:uroporphyrin-III C-methyltransferase/precorrin-2 dehydrogenase/sirohydrochlorin ferrochelatase
MVAAMKTFLASFPLADRQIVVVGGGEMAVAKVRMLAKTPARLTWFVPEGESYPSVAGASAPVRATPSVECFKPQALVFVALADEALAREVVAIAKIAGALVNVVDRPELSDFQTPALIDRGDVVIGVATGGTAPLLARDIRARIEALLPPGLSMLASLAGEIRDAVKTKIPDFLARRQFWEKALRGHAARLATDGQASEARREFVRLLNTADERRGVVHIVGAGPGDPELLTLKALRVLQEAEVVVYDRLISPAVLDYARRDARLIYVGKANSDHSVPQQEIESLMIREAQKGFRVIRLKGGDPFVFGRGGEELETLRKAGVEVHVIAGISAALGCAASAGIPLTHRDHAQAVTLLTGHARADGPPIDWAALSGARHTLVFYMGITAAQEIAANLLNAGRNPQTPIAIVENGTLPEQRVVTGALQDLPGIVVRLGLQGPALLFVGETANWVNTLPARELKARAA